VGVKNYAPTEEQTGFSAAQIVKLFFTGPVVKTELLIAMLEKHGIAATQEFADASAPDDGDLDRLANVLVPEADFERARQLFFVGREDEL